VNIQEATIKALACGGCVTREAWPQEYCFRVQPTASPDGCVAHSGAGRAPMRMWAPFASDLTADDWFVVSKHGVKLPDEDLLFYSDNDPVSE